MSRLGMIHNNYHGNYGGPLKYDWQTDGEAYDENAENLRMIQDAIFKQWGKENATARDAWDAKSDWPNYAFFKNLADWTWSEVQNELSIARNELVKDKAKSPETLALWNSFMDANELTKAYVISIEADKTSDEKSDKNKKEEDKSPKGMNPLIIVGIVGALGLGAFLFIKSRGSSDSE